LMLQCMEDWTRITWTCKVSKMAGGGKREWQYEPMGVRRLALIPVLPFAECRHGSLSAPSSESFALANWHRDRLHNLQENLITLLLSTTTTPPVNCQRTFPN
jgi:hypothetical protein